MGIKEKSEVESETWEESETKTKFFLQEKLGLETEGINIERARMIRKKDERKRRSIIAKYLNYNQHEKMLKKYKELKLWEDQIYINKDTIDTSPLMRHISSSILSKVRRNFIGFERRINVKIMASTRRGNFYVVSTFKIDEISRSSPCGFFYIVPTSN